MQASPWPLIATLSFLSNAHHICVMSLSCPCHPCHIPIIPIMSLLCPQLLVGLGVGDMSSMVLHQSTHHPPHEQLLMRLGECGVSSMVGVVGVVVVHHLSAVVSGSKGVRGLERC